MAKERGQVKTLVAGKRFGFIERPAPAGQAKPQDVFFLFGDYPQGQTPQVGDELEFEAIQEPGKKGPKATVINIVAKAPIAPVSAPPTSSGSAPAAPSATVVPTETTPTATPEPLDAVVVFLYDMNEFESTKDKLDLLVVIKVTTPNGQPIRGAKVDFHCEEQRIKYPAACPNTNQNGEAYFRIYYERGLDSSGQKYVGAPLQITSLGLAVTVSYGGKSLVLSEIVPRSKGLSVQSVSAPAPNVPSPPVSPSPLPAIVAACAPPSVKAISAQMLGLREGAICFRVNTRCGDAQDSPGINGKVHLVTAMDLEVSYAYETGKEYVPAVDGNFSTGKNGVAFVKILVKPSTRNGYVQFFVKGTNIKTEEQYYIKTSLAEAARPVQTV